MKLKKAKKGFTLVELVVVIAIIAILSTVSVVGYLEFNKKANISVDKALVSQLNAILKADQATNGKAETPTEAIEAVKESGYLVEKLAAKTSKYKIVWNQKDNEFALLDEEEKAVAGKVSSNAYENWVFADSYNADKGYSVYLNSGYSGNSTLDITTGLDVGENSNIEVVNYTNTESAKHVVIRTNGGELTVNAPLDTVEHYEKADKVVITSIANESFHEYGEVTGNIEIESGHLAVESTANVSTIVAKPTNTVKLSVTNEENVGTIVTTDTTKTTLNVPESVKPSESLSEDKLAEMEKFDGGLGTEKSPYLISTADQLVQIEDGKSYSLISDIDLTSKPLILELATNSHISSFKNGVLNGNGYTITMAEGASFVNHAEYSKFNDINFIFNYKGGTDQTIIEYSSNLTMTNVHTYGSASMTGNIGLFCLYLGKGEISNTYATFTNCVNHANITGTSYNSLFVGYTFVGNNTVLNFDGCKNDGNFVSTEGAFYLANCAGQGSPESTSVTMNIKNSGNTETGIFRVTNTSKKFNPYIYHFASGSKILVKEDNETKVDVTKLEDISSSLPFNCFIGPNDTNLKISLNEDNTFTISKSSYENVAKYVVRVGLYSQIVKTYVGTQIVYVTETIENNGSDSYKTTLKNLNFTETKGKDKGTIGDGAVVVEVNGIEYYYFNVENCGLKNGTQKATIFEVLAYDSNGTLISSYKASF